MKRRLLLLFSSFCCALPAMLQEHAKDATIIDSRHYSNVFGEIRNFRIFLPPGYGKEQDKKYPVIYFFHGWGQRYFGEGADEYAGYDKGDQNKGDNISSFVSSHNVIVVKADGYNRRYNEEYYRRPYNVLPVETYRQFPIYFPELVNYIDGHYQTIANRQHRAISGLSMGGFMTFMIAAKYPHLVSSAGSFCGAPEFTIGPIDFPVEYRHMDMYKNLAGINVRLHYGDKDFIRSYHEDMNRMWPQVMDNYYWKVYDAEHSTCGMGEMFETFMTTFEHPLPQPGRWDHTEVYPAFEVWDYRFNTDRTVPGFTVIENADKRGFRIAVREFVPDGELIRNVRVEMITAPLYEKNQSYIINDLDLFTMKDSQFIVKSNIEGRLKISINGSAHEIGINKKNDKPELVIAGIELQDASWAAYGKEVKLKVKLLNKGMNTAGNVKAALSARAKNIKIANEQTDFGNVAVNEIKEGHSVFSFTSEAETVEIIQFSLSITDEKKDQWTQSFDLNIKKEGREINGFEIADGRTLSVTSAGIDMETLTLGKGNGDGVANPGESIVVLVKDSGKLWRTDLTFSDRYINPGGVVTRRSDWWTNMDHVGASAKYDELLIASDCPQDHSIGLLAEYWVPKYPYHIRKQGMVKLKIQGSDHTPPSIGQIQARGDNTVEVKIVDGGKIENARARFIMQDEPEKTFTVTLKDEGTEGDITANDHVYSVKIPDSKFGIYRVIVETEDTYGNKSGKESTNLVVLH